VTLFTVLTVLGVLLRGGGLFLRRVSVNVVGCRSAVGTILWGLGRLDTLCGLRGRDSSLYIRYGGRDSSLYIGYGVRVGVGVWTESQERVQSISTRLAGLDRTTWVPSEGS